MLPSELMWNARAQLEKGWCQGKLEDQDGNVCLVGALNKAIYGTAMIPSNQYRHDVFDVKYQAQRALAQTMNGSDIVSFNNHPNTTQADVLALMEKAAIALEEQGR